MLLSLQLVHQLGHHQVYKPHQLSHSTCLYPIAQLQHVSIQCSMAFAGVKRSHIQRVGQSQEARILRCACAFRTRIFVLCYTDETARALVGRGTARRAEEPATATAHVRMSIDGAMIRCTVCTPPYCSLVYL